MLSRAADMRAADLMLALRHHEAGRLNDAERGYMRLHRASPRDTEVLFLLGVLCCDLGIYEPACRFLGEALTLAPDFPEARRQLAAAQRELVASLNALGLERLQHEQWAAAETALRRVLALEPGHTQAHNNLGLALLQQGRVADSQRCFEAALERNPGYVNARINLANGLRMLRQHQDARRHLETVLAAQPDCVEALNNLGAVAQDMGDADLALGCLSRAFVLSPDTPRVRWNLALTQLQLGDFSNGWRNFESRWEGCEHLRDGNTLPRERAWNGESLRGKRVLLWAEQGFGDTLQFIRFARDVAARRARVSCWVPPELARLLRSVAGVGEIVAQGGMLPDYDVHCPLMSLPYRLGLPLDSDALHGRRPYVFAPPDTATRWRTHLSGYSGLKVGLAWAGNARRQSMELAAVDARRSLALAMLTPLLAVRGCVFFSLQKGPASAERDACHAVHDFSAHWSDFADTAAFIAALDLVVSVDTAVAHLAAALGKPVWLLNRYDSCWRWLRERDDSPWYSSVRQFRQSEPGAWTPVVAAVASALSDTAAGEFARRAG